MGESLKDALRRSWHKVCSGLGPRLENFFELVCVYSEEDRHYHNLNHIKAMASKLLQIEEENPGMYDYVSIHRAIWFHDYYYDTHRHDNEDKSADMAGNVLGSWAIDSEKISNLILFTKDHTVPDDDPDGKLFVDLDLSILGADSLIYERYAADIRKEYSWVEEIDYIHGRLVVLKKMLSRRIFETVHFEDLEPIARRNICREIEILCYDLTVQENIEFDII